MTAGGRRGERGYTAHSTAPADMHSVQDSCIHAPCTAPRDHAQGGPGDAPVLGHRAMIKAPDRRHPAKTRA